MKRLASMACCTMLFAAAAAEDTTMIRNGSFSEWDQGAPVGWELVAQREAVRPGLVDATAPDGASAVALQALATGLSIGRLVQSVTLPEALQKPDSDTPWLRFSCDVSLTGNLSPLENVLVALFWERSTDKGSGWGPPVRHFVSLVPEDAQQRRYRASLEFPLVHGGGDLQIVLAQIGGTAGAARFSRVALKPIPEPPPRVIRVASAYYMPKGKGTWARNLAGIDQLTAEAADKDCDLILFGEGVTVVGSGKSYVDVAEPIPGPASDDLARVAAKYGIFLVAGLYEREGDAAYNTAVMFDRKGELVGKYRKIHLPHPELFAGLMPGDGFPVFDTELGRIGIQICYDHHFQESSRCLAAAGAEIILTPIWGDMRSDGECYDAVARARALDNGVFYVMSVYSLRRSLIADPHGRILAHTTGEDAPNLAIADCDLRQLYSLNWTYRVPPNIQQGFRAERRPSSYRALLGMDKVERDTQNP